LRAMVYSALPYADSTRKIKTDKDPIEISLNLAQVLKQRDLSNYPHAITYVTQNSDAAHIYQANQHIEKQEYDHADNSLAEVERLGAQSIDVLRNLADLSAEAGKTQEAIAYYKKLIELTDVDAVTYISLAKLYKSTDNTHEYLNTLKTAREKFPQDKAILFLLVEAYAENKAYAAVTPIIAEALKHEPENI